MTQTSVGFNGVVNDLQWARFAALLAAGEPSLGKPGDLQLAQVASTRSVTVAAGVIAANGVATTLDAAETVAVPIPTNGQWHLLVLNRVWATGVTQLTLRPGPTTATSPTPPALPAAYPATFATNHGVNSDAAIAWLWVNSANTTVAWAPIALPNKQVNPRRGTATQRTAWYQGLLGGLTSAWMPYVDARWYDTDNEWETIYYIGRNATGSMDAGRVSGWYPVLGHMPGFEVGSTTQGQAGDDTFLDLGQFATADRSTWGPPSYAGSGFWTLGLPGKWLLVAQASYPAQAAGKRALRLNQTNAPNQTAFGDNGSGSGSVLMTTEIVTKTATDQIKLAFYQKSGSAMNGVTLDFWRVTYLGPN